MIRIGIVGAGWWAGVHAPAFVAAGATIAGVCSRSPGPAEALASASGVEALDFERLLDVSDAIAISSPDESHARYALAAIGAGRHVFVEKPLAHTTAEAQEILDAAEAQGVVGMTGLTGRGDPITEQARTLVADGAIGRVIYARGAFDLDLFADPSAATTWRLQREMSGPGGLIADLGPHLFDLAEYVSGLEIEEVTARGGLHLQREPPVSNLDEAAVLAKLGDVSALLSLTRVHLGRSAFRLEIHGTSGALVLDWGIWAPGEGLHLARRPGGFERMDVPVPSDGPYRYGLAQFGELARRFIRAVEEGEPPNPSLANGVRMQRLVDAATESVATSRTVVP